MPTDVEQARLKLERTGEIQSYYNLITHTSEHKIRGYASFCRAGVDLGEGFEFIFQISSDAKIRPESDRQRQPDVLEAHRNRRMGAVL